MPSSYLCNQWRVDIVAPLFPCIFLDSSSEFQSQAAHTFSTHGSMHQKGSKPTYRRNPKTGLLPASTSPPRLGRTGAASDPLGRKALSAFTTRA